MPKQPETRLCACGCGRRIPTTYRAFGDKEKAPRTRIYYDRTRCRVRAMRKLKDPPEIVECVCGCGNTFPNRTKYGRPRRWWSAKCRNRTTISLSEQAQQNKREREAARRKEIRGRVCDACGKDDSDGKWGSGTTLMCENCRRQAKKRPCARCGGPFYVYAHKPSGRPAGCLRQNRLGTCGGLE